uniref:Phorbol-ester/DAG-type domain-containing protein n=1 Tax=Scylla olivacea TaxID=85551 RepID=A0A0N7ZB38_SCYOL
MGSSGQEEAPGIFWAWVEAASGNMALALTTLVEQVQSWAKGVGVGGLLTLQPVMDTLGTLLVGWMIFVTLILILGTFFYFKFIHHLENEGTDTASQGRGEDKGGARTSGSATQGKAKAIRKEEQARKPTIVPERKADPVSAPVGTGADPDAVKWACNVFTWLYNSAEGGKVVNKVWLDTLNENTVKTAIETGILIEVVELMKQTPAPTLSNMVVDCSPTDNVTITCDCDATLYLRIITTRTQGDRTTESEYACAVTPLRGRLNIAAVTAELLAVAKFDGWPEVSLTLEGIRNNATGRDEQQMLDVINEVVSSALRNSVLEFNFQPNQTFPRFRRARQVPDPIIPVGYDSMSTTSHSTTSQPMGIPGLNGKRLLVKIVKAMGVGCEKPVFEAYSVVEMDEPPQKFTTSVVKDTNSPFWDEQFLFDLSGGTLELLFELYDKSSGTFLGLGIVGIEELVATPSQRQIIPLQSRPYENDEVSGSLTVEFLFLDRADLPEHTLRASTTSKSVTPRGDLITTTTTTYIKAPEAQDVVVNGGDGVAAAAIRDIEEKTVVTNNASRSTMIIHASKKVQRAPSGEYEEVLLQPDQDGQGYMADDLYNLTMTATTTGTPTITTTGASTAMPSTTTTTTTVATSSVPPSTAASTTEPAEDEERGRSRGVRRKRDSFFGTLKKRFSRSKVRSKSMDPGMRDSSLERDPSVGRSISMERSSTLNRASVPDEAQPGTPSTQDSAEPRLLSVPSGAGGDAGSTRSSLSDASAISGSSTRTYVNEASTLIIETSENGVFKHYLIPLSLQQKSKWRKKGLKLHIFGEHTFIAKHMSSSTQCEVCQKTLGRRFGKQGYICRDCGYKCHKPCHVKTEITCPNSTVNNMDLEYVRDPKEERRAWLKKTKTT